MSEAPNEEDLETEDPVNDDEDGSYFDDYPDDYLDDYPDDYPDEDDEVEEDPEGES